MGKQIVIQKPHVKQWEILDNRKRFNFLRCGRRFGKTSLVSYLTAENANGYTGIFAPTYKDLHEIWLEVKNRFEPITISKNEQLKQIIFNTGGKVDFWSLEDPNSGRGRKYHRIIIDEAEKVGCKLEEAWTMNLRYTLIDYSGDCYMFTTPKGIRTYFDKLYVEAKDNEDSACFQYSTADNPFIPRDEIENILKSHDQLSLQQEFYGNPVDWGANNRAFYNFNRENHSSASVKYNPAYPLWISTDFNVDPQCAVVCQFDPYLKWCYFLKEYRMPNSGVVEMCNQIKADYPNALLMIEGDRTGWNRKQDGTYGLTNNYQILRDHLRLNWSQIKVPKTSNPPHSDTLNLVNMCLTMVDVKFHNSMIYTMLDMETVQVDSNKHIMSSKDSNLGHLLDCVRYLFYGQFSKLSKMGGIK